MTTTAETDIEKRAREVLSTIERTGAPAAPWRSWYASDVAALLALVADERVASVATTKRFVNALGEARDLRASLKAAQDEASSLRAFNEAIQRETAASVERWEKAEGALADVTRERDALKASLVVERAEIERLEAARAAAVRERDHLEEVAQALTESALEIARERDRLRAEAEACGHLTREQMAAVMDIIENPRPPTPAMVALMANYRARAQSPGPGAAATTGSPTVDRLISDAGMTLEEAGPLPDGSGFAVASMPLPKDHWLYADGFNVPPMPYRRGTGPTRDTLAKDIRDAAKYAIRASTMNGKVQDFDPDAIVQNFVVGMLGYWTSDGLSSDAWANPPAGDTGPGAHVDEKGGGAQRCIGCGTTRGDEPGGGMWEEGWACAQCHDDGSGE